MLPAFHFVSSADLPNLKASECSAHLVPFKTNTAMRDSKDRNFTLSDETLDASSRQIQKLCNLILL
jgi:hypothetical protein